MFGEKKKKRKSISQQFCLFIALPFSYPFNHCSFLNGTKVDPHGGFPDNAQELTFGMEGIIDEKEYSKMLNQTWFGSAVPIANVTTRDFNTAGSWFPFWSSPAMTYAAALRAFVNFNSLMN